MQALYTRVVTARYRARLEAALCETGRCDPLSVCHRNAATLNNMIIEDLTNSATALVERCDYVAAAENCGLTAAAFADAMRLLDGTDNKLTSRRCNTLALATISEALLQADARSCFGYEAEMMGRLMIVLDALERHVAASYKGTGARRDSLFRYLGKGCLLASSAANEQAGV